MKKIVLATDLGGTNLRMASITTDGEILSRIKYKTPRSDNPDEIIGAMANAVEDYRSKLEDQEIVAFAAAVPGTINFEKGLINNSPNLPELDGFEIVKALETKLGIRAILENDANAAAIGENWLGASKGIANSILVTLGTGVGGGIIIDENIIRGIDGTAGEIGHINVEIEGHPCGCGSIGCVEQYASATAIMRMARELANENSGSDTIDKECLTSEDIFQMAVNGNDLAREVFQRQGFYLGIMLAGLINTLNPEVIVIGGGASGSWDLFIPHLTEQIKLRSYRQPAERAKIVRAELGDDAGILGVAKLGFSE